MYKCVSKGSCTPNLQFCFVCFRPCVSFWLLPPPCSGTVSSYLMFAGIKWPYCQSLFTALFLTFTARSPVRSLTLEGEKMTSQSSLRIVFFVVSYFGTTVSFISALDKYISAKKQAQRIKETRCWWGVVSFLRPVRYSLHYSLLFSVVPLLYLSVFCSFFFHLPFLHPVPAGICC